MFALNVSFMVEWLSMNSSVMPDKNKDESTFRDYQFASKAISALERLHKKNQDYFMIALGFKMPHLCLHVPQRTFDMYRNKAHIWENVSDAYLSHPPTVPVTGN